LTESGQVQSERVRRRRVIPRLLPVTRLGRYSVELFAASTALFAVSSGLVAAGQEGPGFNPWLALTVFPAALSAVLAGVTAAFSIFRRRERSPLVFLALLVGLFVTWFALGGVISGD
jgi:hypothetical protein